MIELMYIFPHVNSMLLLPSRSDYITQSLFATEPLLPRVCPVSVPCLSRVCPVKRPSICSQILDQAGRVKGTLTTSSVAGGSVTSHNTKGLDRPRTQTHTPLQQLFVYAPFYPVRYHGQSLNYDALFFVL
jgi:hypothetical protein